MTHLKQVFSIHWWIQIKEESEEESEKESEEESEEKKSKKTKDDFKNFIKYIENEWQGINYNLFKYYFNFVAPIALAKKFYETKNKNKKNELVKEIKNRWSNLKGKIKTVSEDEKKINKPDKILEIVEKVLDFN